MNSQILRDFFASWRFSLNLISCFIDLWDSLNTAKGKVWACQRGCQETIRDGKYGIVCPQKEFLAPAGQSTGKWEYLQQIFNPHSSLS